MRLGVLSDTHGKADACRAAVELLQKAKVDAFLHCGDIGDYARPAEPVFDALAGTGCHFVWGNNDDVSPAAARYASDLGLVLHEPYEPFTLGETTIVLAHGDAFSATRRLLREAESTGHGPDLLLTGHSHAPHDERIGPVRWINPGALFRTRTKTVATIDTTHLTRRSALRLLTVDVTA
ncbi:MAG: YfcE family phosphodiesterase [Planctomycetota bacterium]